ncbi:MAG: ATP-binding protein [Clostridiales bacterium]|nr:ATP-binding protein [Clostridiales bacterium]
MGRKPGKKGERASRKKKNKGLRGRWLTHTVGPVSILAAVCVVIITACFAVYYYSNMQADLSHRAKTTTEFFANYIGQSYNEYYQSCISYARSFEDKNTIELQFISTGGRIVASSYGQWAGKNPTTPDVQNAMDTQKIASYLGRDPATGERIMAVSSPMIYRNGEVIGVLRYVTSMKLVDRQLAFAALIALGAGALFVLVVIISSSFYIRSILEPVAEITATAKRIAGGSYGVQIKSQYDDEIGELAQTINDMSNKINQNEKLQTEFISSLSHELRTPLTAISGWSETLLSGDALDPEETRRGIAIIQRESRRLTEMVTELLDFTRMEDGRMTLNVEMTDLRAEFEDTVYMYGSRLRQEGIALRVLDNDDDIPEIPCDPKRMRQVLLNILDNAAKHGGEGKVIEASMALEGENIVIRIRDYGPGIPEDELPLVKKKFFKGSSKARGSGIGLAVCDEIVEMHGGRLDLENAPGGGTLVTIRLPAAEQ